MLDAHLVRVLVDNLEASRSLFERLQDVLLRERDAILSFDIPSVRRTTADKEELTLEHRRLERERAHILAGAGLGGRTLDELAAMGDRGQRARLLALRSELETLVQTVREMNGFNRELLDATLQGVRRKVQRLTESRPTMTYAHLAGPARVEGTRRVP